MKKIQNLLLLAGLFLSYNSLGQRDTAIADCYDAFFKGCLPVKNKASLKVLQKNGKETPLTAFMKAAYIEKEAQLGLKDLDGDGTKELVIWNFTGGAHCCDEFYFFKNSGLTKYSYAAKLFAGNTCVDATNTFTFNLHESFGYFFTCFACGLETGDGAAGKSGLQYLQDIFLQYKDGKLVIQPGTEAAKATVRSNLLYLKKLGWDGGVKEADFDDGRRKELALNLAYYYFSFGKDLTETKKLFTTYYPYKDAVKVWAQFVENLSSLKKNNDF